MSIQVIPVQSALLPWFKISISRLILLIICFTKSWQAYGQYVGNRENHHEYIYIHLDNTLYVAGESMRYKVYMLDLATENRESCSKILYFSLTGINDQISINWRINLTGKPIYGNYMLPTDLPTGHYLLTAYTNWMRNGSSDSLFTRSLLIVNLTESTPSQFMFGKTAYPAANSWHALSHHDVSLKLKTSKPTYTVHEPVELEMNLNSRLANIAGAELSVSVSAETPFMELLDEPPGDDTLLPNNQSIIASLNSGNLSANSGLLPCKYRVEDKGFILIGWIKSRKNNSPLANGEILLAITDSISPRILGSLTDSNGRFLFYLNQQYDNRQLIFQLAHPFKSEDFFWEFDLKAVEIPSRSIIPYILLPGEIDYISKIKDIRLIEAIYADHTVVESQGKAMEGVNYFRPAQRIIFPRDYADMVNFKEIADNIIPELRFGFRKGEFFMLVLSNRANEWRKSNMVLLNGVPFTDMNYISTLGTKDIQSIEVITATYLMGGITLQGLVSIYTYSNSIPENYLKNHTILFKNTVIANDTNGYAVVQSNSGSSDAHLPNFSSILYWNPSVHITCDATMVIEFPASMLTGKYTATIEGLTTGGFPVRATASFKVIE